MELDTFRRLGLSSALLMFLLLSLGLAGAPATASGPDPPSPAASVITVDTSPSGLLISVNGTPAQTPYAFPCEPGTSRTLTAISPQENGSTRYVFVSWSDGDNQTHVISCNVSANFTATFTIEYRIRMDSFPSGRRIQVDGTLFTTPAAVWCVPGSTPFVNALFERVGGVRFTPTNWSDGVAVAHTVGCGPSNLTAFYRVEYSTGLFSDPPGLAVSLDSTGYRTPEVYWCAERTVHTLEVSSPQRDLASGTEYVFARWSDSPVQKRPIVCDGPANYTAIFIVSSTVPPPFELTGWLILLIVVCVVGLTVLLAFLGLRFAARGTAGTPTAPPIPSLRSCPRCKTPAGLDWSYCMQCGAVLR